MKHVLSMAHVDVLSRFVKRRVLVAFDFDGTLAPIAEERVAARMRRRTIRLLERLCAVYPCAVISGRAREDVLTRLEGLPVRHVVGHHGLEPERLAADDAHAIEGVRAHLSFALRDIAGVELEDKRYTLAVHYRRAQQPRAVRIRIARVLRALPSRFRILAGKSVFEVLPARAAHKGHALERLRAAENVPGAVYVGDDVTDEDVFRRAHPERLLAIRIGRSRASAAPYYLRDQVELDALLEHVTRA